jgi:hypothetical protein
MGASPGASAREESRRLGGLTLVAVALEYAFAAVRWLLALVVARTAVMLAPVASARVPNACTLLTTAQARTVLGVQLHWKQAQGDRETRWCTVHGLPYSSAAMGQHPAFTLMVSETTRARFQRLYRRLVPVREVGKLAYFSEGVVNELHVYGNGYGLLLAIPEDRGIPWGKQVAAAALGHL